eukprot:gene2084-17654_t
MARKPSRSTPVDDKKDYQPERVRSTATSNRIGPIPADECKVRGRRERPGQLAVKNKKEDSSTPKNAGSFALLEYFYRLSTEDNKEQTINLLYIKALLTSGADINISDSYGQTVLHAAARDWNTDVACFLLDNGALVDKQDAYGRTPLFIAAALDNPQMIRFLVANGAHINKKTYGEKQTPFHYAVRSNAVRSLKELVKLGADVSAEDSKGRCPLFVAAENGVPEVVQYLLEIGCPAAVFNKRGYSAMTLMVEKMPNIAMEALYQYVSVNTKAESKTYYLAPLEWNPNDPDADRDLKTTLEMIVKYKEMDLLQHPVIERLLHLKTKLYARSYLLLYLFLNTVYVLLWCTLSILMSATHEPFHWSKDNFWKVALALLVLLLTLAAAIEQVFLGRAVQKSENNWKLYRIESLQEDLRYCHPQWPNERKVLEAQIERYSNMVGDYYKNFWTYLEWIIFVAAVSWNISSAMDTFGTESKHTHTAMQILMIIVLMLNFIKFLKACRMYKLAGQYIAICGNVVYALGQFAFLFFLFFIPFNVAFWIFFGGKENGKIIGERYQHLAKAFENLNDVIYSVWTLTLVVGFPMKALVVIDAVIGELYVCIYYLVMSVVLLNLFIALMSNLFARVHKDAEKYALLEQAKTVILCDRLIKRTTIEKFRNHMQSFCNPLMIVKYKEMDLLQHPCDRRFTLETSCMPDRICYYTYLNTSYFWVEQSRNREQLNLYRIESLQKTFVICHPQWPNDTESSLKLQIGDTPNG